MKRNHCKKWWILNSYKTWDKTMKSNNSKMQSVIRCSFSLHFVVLTLVIFAQIAIASSKSIEIENSDSGTLTDNLNFDDFIEEEDYRDEADANVIESLAAGTTDSDDIPTTEDPDTYTTVDPTDNPNTDVPTQEPTTDEGSNGEDDTTTESEDNEDGTTTDSGDNEESTTDSGDDNITEEATTVVDEAETTVDTTDVPSNSTDDNSTPPDDEGLSDGEIAAIVICSLGGVALIGGGAYYAYTKREKYVELNGSSTSSDPMPPFDNPAYSTDGTEHSGYQFGKSTL